MSLSDEIANEAAPAGRRKNNGTIDLTSDGAQVNNVVVEGDLNGDWSKVFALFNLDAAHFEVVDDTVKMSTWQQSKRSDDGERDAIQLYSYSAKFKRLDPAIRIPVEAQKKWRANLMRTKFPEPKAIGKGGVYLILVADPQLGKKGTEEAKENWKNGITEHIREVQRGDYSGIHIAFMGDETENVVNSYGNQPHTIELNRSDQMLADYDLRVWSLKQALQTGLKVSASSVISNHGEWTRNGGKDPVTTRNDNASTFIAKVVKKQFEDLEEYGVPPISWTIGETTPGITLKLAGVECYFSHGYVEKGRGGSTELRTKSAIERQILGRTEDLGTTKLWFMAHYHHDYSMDFEGRTLFGCPALEAERSSEYMLEQFGVWSPPGMLGLVITNKVKRGWLHKNIF